MAWWNIFWGRPKYALEAPGLRESVQRFVADPRSGEAEARELLAFAREQCDRLIRLANGYPHGEISPNVWMDGAGMVATLDALSDDLQRRALPAEEEGRSLAIRAACAVMSHYPEEVFPRVVRRGAAAERWNKPEVAVQCYLAVVRDYEEIGLQQDVETGEPLGGGTTIALEAVRDAMRRLLPLAPEHVSVEVLARLDARLAESDDTRA